MDCVGENTLLDYAGGRLPPEKIAAVDAHVDACGSCREVLAGWLAEGSQPSAERTPEALPARLTGGMRVGRYVILKQLGAGGMGIVYTAYDPELDRTVCLKMIRGELADTIGQEAQARLLREAQAMARLAHANVVAVHDIGVFAGGVFIAMDYVEGSTLRDWNEERKRLWREVIEVYVAAGRGLAAAHARGLVHRDFKPENVLIGSDGVTRVTDFGLVRPAGTAGASTAGQRATPAALDSPLTVLGRIIGTPQYMSPEQLKGAAADARSDQFSFCVALYQDLYGERPFAGDTIDDVLVQIEACHVRPPVPHSSVPRWVRRALLKGLAADPAKRHRDMAELLRLLTLERPRARAATRLAVVLALVTIAVPVALHLREGTTSRALAVSACPGGDAGCVARSVLAATSHAAEVGSDDALCAAAMTDLVVLSAARGDAASVAQLRPFARAKIARVASAVLEARLAAAVQSVSPAAPSK